MAEKFRIFFSVLLYYVLLLCIVLYWYLLLEIKPDWVQRCSNLYLNLMRISLTWRTRKKPFYWQLWAGDSCSASSNPTHPGSRLTPARDSSLVETLPQLLNSFRKNFLCWSRQPLIFFAFLGIVPPMTILLAGSRQVPKPTNLALAAAGSAVRQSNLNWTLQVELSWEPWN